MNKISVAKTLSLMKQHTKDFVVPSVSEIAEITKDPFQVLISCIISLRTKDAVTIQASKRLFAVADTVQKMTHLSEQEIARLIYPAGFYKTKAKNIKKICGLLLAEHRGKVPSAPDDLMKLPGVGRKTAAITMVYGHASKSHIPVDVHVHVIANRLGLVRTTKPEETEDALKNIIPRRYWRDINNLFVQFGQNICVTVSPYCGRCTLRPYCPRVGVTRSR